LHHGDQAVLGEWLQQKSIGSGVVRARARCKDADDQNLDVTSLGVCFELTTQRETVELRHQDLAQHEIRFERGNKGQRFVPIRRQLDTMAGIAEEVSRERSNVRITLDDKDG
jgi:hypothetical protein